MTNKPAAASGDVIHGGRARFAGALLGIVALFALASWLGWPYLRLWWYHQFVQIPMGLGCCVLIARAYRATIGRRGSATNVPASTERAGGAGGAE